MRTRKDLINVVRNSKEGLTVKDATNIVENLIMYVLESTDQPILLKGFGKFEWVKIHKQKRYNPQKKKKEWVKPYKILKFRSSKTTRIYE